MTLVLPEDAEAASAWAFGQPASLTPIGDGVLNRCLLFEAAGQQLVLRACHYTERKHIEREYALIMFAKDHGVPVVAPIPLPSGDTILMQEGHFYALFPFIRDRQYRRGTLGANEAAAMGRCLGHIHRVLEPCTIPASREVRTTESYERTLAAMDAIRQAIAAHADPGDDETRTLTTLDGMRDYIVQTPPPTQPLEALPFQLLHGDYHERNLFFANGEVSAVIDWELSLHGPRGREIMRTLLFVWDLELEPCVAFLAAYQQVWPLPIAELDLAARWFAWSRGHNLWVYQAIYLEGNEQARQLIGSGQFEPLEARWAQIYAVLQDMYE